MTITLFLDIETIGTARQDVRDYIAASIKPPGNISKAETIAKWELESKPAAIADAIDKTSFDGAFGRVCCIGFAMDDGEPEAVFSANDERHVLEGFAYILDRSLAGERFTTTVVGHNVGAFDLRFLHQRYIVHGIRPPIVIARAISARPWESEKVYDTMVQWAGVGNRVSLDKLCLALSIPSPKAGMDGSQVAEYVAAGRIEDVAAYCRGDVAATREVWRHMTFSTAHALRGELEAA